jgi:hypothetical protein
MSVFDELDAMVSAATDELLGSKVTWRPSRIVGGGYTNGTTKPDPTRPIREDLTAIVTWRPVTVEMGNSPEQGGVLGFAVAVDFDQSQFRIPGSEPPAFEVPRKGDLLELEDEYQDNRLVQIEKPGDDGSERLIYYCQSPK